MVLGVARGVGRTASRTVGGSAGVGWVARAERLFLIALSVRPGISLTIALHLVPYRCTLSMMTRSSSSVHDPFFTSGQR